MKGVARMNSRAYYQQLNSSGGLADTDTRTVYAPSSNVKRYPLAEYATKHFNIEELIKEEKINSKPGMTAADILTTYSDSPLKCPLHKGLDEASVKIVIDISVLIMQYMGDYPSKKTPYGTTHNTQHTPRWGLTLHRRFVCVMQSHRVDDQDLSARHRQAQH
jgi:hypothetical protein